MTPKYQRPPDRIFVDHRRKCEECLVLFDCQKPAQWVCDACQEKREALTPQTVTDPKALLARIVADRGQGYALVDREAEPHFRSISVPVRRYDNVIVAAINMGAHVDRVPVRELTDRFLPLLREGAESVRSTLL